MNGTKGVKLRKFGLLARAAEYRQNDLIASIIENSPLITPPKEEEDVPLPEFVIYSPHDYFDDQIREMERIDRPKTAKLGLLKWAAVYRERADRPKTAKLGLLKWAAIYRERAVTRTAARAAAGTERECG